MKEGSVRIVDVAVHLVPTPAPRFRWWVGLPGSEPAGIGAAVEIE